MSSTPPFDASRDASNRAYYANIERMLQRLEQDVTALEVQFRIGPPYSPHPSTSKRTPNTKPSPIRISTPSPPLYIPSAPHLPSIARFPTMQIERDMGRESPVPKPPPYTPSMPMMPSMYIPSFPLHAGAYREMERAYRARHSNASMKGLGSSHVEGGHEGEGEGGDEEGGEDEEEVNDEEEVEDEHEVEDGEEVEDEEEVYDPTNPLIDGGFNKKASKPYDLERFPRKSSDSDEVNPVAGPVPVLAAEPESELEPTEIDIDDYEIEYQEEKEEEEENEAEEDPSISAKTPEEPKDEQRIEIDIDNHDSEYRGEEEVEEEDSQISAPNESPGEPKEQKDQRQTMEEESPINGPSEKFWSQLFNEESKSVGVEMHPETVNDEQHPVRQEDNVETLSNQAYSPFEHSPAPGTPSPGADIVEKPVAEVDGGEKQDAKASTDAEESDSSTAKTGVAEDPDTQMDTYPEDEDGENVRWDGSADAMDITRGSPVQHVEDEYEQMQYENDDGYGDEEEDEVVEGLEEEEEEEEEDDVMDSE